ncbi:MAG: hypothetical protein KF850_01930 [Labilithrix sp.]|nr:hypothetical protein [Labilithrix sp.]MBX3210772.1 hypothetical protein [Labilithrix sp.]
MLTGYAHALGKVAYVVGLLATAAAGTIAMATETFTDVKLEGAELTAPVPSLGLRALRTEVFQKESTAWFEQRWGLRGYAVRADNTLGVELFHETRVDQDAVVGRDGVLFTRDDLAYVNRNDPPDQTIALARRFARLQTQLLERGTVLLPVIAPSKTSFHRDAIPTAWRRRGAFGQSDKNLYGAFVGTLEESGALFVDGRALLRAEVDAATTQPEDVFARPARHWGLAAACRVLQASVDTVRREIRELGDEQIDCKATLDRNPSVDHVNFDIFKLLNTWKAKPAAVDVDVLVGQQSGDRLHVPTLYVGSSFVWAFAQVTRERGALNPALCYFYDESVHDPLTTRFVKKVEPFTDTWRADTLARRLIIVVILETYLPVDGVKFLGELEAEIDSPHPP